MRGKKEVKLLAIRQTKMTVLVATVVIGVLYCAATGHAFSVVTVVKRSSVAPSAPATAPQHHYPSSCSSLIFSFPSSNTRHYFKAETEEEKTAALEIQQQEEAAAAQKQQEQADDETWQEQEKVERMATFLSSRLGMAFLKAKKQQKEEEEASVQASVKDEVITDDDGDAKKSRTQPQLVVDDNDHEKVKEIADVEAPKTLLETVDVEKNTGKQLEEQEMEAKKTKAASVEDEATMEKATANPLENLELIIKKAAAASGKDEDFEKSLPRGMPSKTEPEQQEQQQDESTVTPLEVQDEQKATIDSTIKDKEVEDERAVPLHQKEGDRVVALKDEFATGEAVGPPVVSTSFGRPLEVIEASVPPLRRSREASPSSSPTVTDNSTEQQQQQQGTESSSSPSSSSLKAMPVVVDHENDVVASAALPVGEMKPEMLDDKRTETSRTMQDVVASVRLPPEERQQQLMVEDTQPELDQTDTRKVDQITTPDLVAQKDTKLTYQTSPDPIPAKAVATNEVKAAAATTPVPIEKTKDSSQTLSEKAFEILLYLGMITITPDPRDPDYDHSKDDELCPENKWKQ